jgi:uncharacterized DUF497 family protein
LFTRFTWDSKKAAANSLKHGVTFEEAQEALIDALSVTTPDSEHSLWEARYLTLGLSAKGRLLAIAHADQDDAVRIISARPATKHERLNYEQGD